MSFLFRIQHFWTGGKYLWTRIDFRALFLTRALSSYASTVFPNDQIPLWRWQHLMVFDKHFTTDQRKTPATNPRTRLPFLVKRSNLFDAEFNNWLWNSFENVFNRLQICKKFWNKIRILNMQLMIWMKGLVLFFTYSMKLFI